jgi:hypothetical protein
MGRDFKRGEGGSLFGFFHQQFAGFLPEKKNAKTIATELWK